MPHACYLFLENLSCAIGSLKIVESNNRNIRLIIGNKFGFLGFYVEINGRTFALVLILGERRVCFEDIFGT